ncbi:ATP-binding protein [Alicyclobacillus fructus]|uniref:ATP-binding protein n=1 Tax=Alicyclobacillus fructus TaxID=2816082 RepID=UPI001A8CF3CF|nr:DUF499 domain-containing protein [Alicyclobacillus fructus]
MFNVRDACRPRPEIIQGTLNLEVFTASLRPVLDFYKTGERRLDDVYLDATRFFSEATYPTRGLLTVLRQTFQRLSGDMTVPAIQRLETGFGGGKTHTLIACTHVAHQGRNLAQVLDQFLLQDVDSRTKEALLGSLPEPGSVTVVGVAGDEIPVHKPQGTDLVPYTLWGEIARQVGGDELYLALGDEVTSFAAPGNTYFDRVFGGRKVLLMLDELAQYAARLEAARPDGASQLAAFLMSLHGYARTHQGIAILLTLASSSDAFARQTEMLKRQLGEVAGRDMTEDEVLAIAERAQKSASSVTARDAVAVTPVDQSELTAVLAKRLFEDIDRHAAEEVASAYMDMYSKNLHMLPADKVPSLRDRMVNTYPFHPTFVDFLNNKLAEAENFQKTRGVLRVLSLVVRNLWMGSFDAPMIHVCHVDLRSREIVDEILGRTGSADLQFILHADIGSSQSSRLEGGMSNAELLDREWMSKIPTVDAAGGRAAVPVHELTWKTVFLNSLVGRHEGLTSNVFGVTEAEAILQTAYPGLAPYNVRQALEAIRENAYYLRYEQGKYFASEEPTINSVLARIRQSLQLRQVEGRLDDVVQRMIQDRTGLFKIVPNVDAPEQVPDEPDQLVLGIVSLWAGDLDLDQFFIFAGENRPRQFQNHVYLLVPNTVRLRGRALELFSDQQLQEAQDRLRDLARHVIAMETLARQPENYGLNPRYLQTQDFMQRRKERDQALQRAVVASYRLLVLPTRFGPESVQLSASSGAESGGAVLNLVRDQLVSAGKLVPSSAVNKETVVALYNLMFADGTDLVMIDQIAQRAKTNRSWPVFETKTLLEQLIRHGVEIGQWCVFQQRSAGDDHRVELYYRHYKDYPDQPLPLSAEIMNGDYGIVTFPGAVQRGWLKPRVDLLAVATQIIQQSSCLRLSDLKEQVWAEIARQTANPADVVRENSIETVVQQLLRSGQIWAYEGTPEQTERPARLWKAHDALYTPWPEHVLITSAEARRRGWEDDGRTGPRMLTIRGHDALTKLWPELPRLESIYMRGGKSKIELLELVDLVGPGVSRITIRFDELDPDALKSLGATFQHLREVFELDDSSEIDMRLEPQEGCPFYQRLMELGLVREVRL